MHELSTSAWTPAKDTWLTPHPVTHSISEMRLCSLTGPLRAHFGGRFSLSFHRLGDLGHLMVVSLDASTVHPHKLPVLCVPEGILWMSCSTNVK